MYQEEMTYQRYYQKAIDLGINGYKPVLGGTGLGKTHGILEVIKANPNGRKFIYVSHRHNLLEEMATKLDGNNIEYVYLKSVSDTLRGLLNDTHQTSELKRLHNDPLFRRYKEFAAKNSRQKDKIKYGSCLNSIDKACEILSLESMEIGQELEALEPEEQFGMQASSILRFFKRIFREINAVKIDLGRESLKDDLQSEGFEEKDQEYFTNNFPIVFDLFPYWLFERSDKHRVLLITIQKLFSGFFDGKGNMNAYRIKDKILFLDEFEFLEPVLLDRIMDESKLENPFTFISYFHYNVSAKMIDNEYLARHKTIKKDLTSIQVQIKEMITKCSFPDIRFFGAKDKQILNQFVGSAIYQSNFTTVDRVVYLEKDTESMKYWVVDRQEPNSISSFQLMKYVKSISSSILQFYLRLKADDEKLYLELLEDAYDQTEYIKYINKLSFFSVAPRAQVGKKAPKLTNFSYLYHKGFSQFTLKRPHTETEPNELFLENYLVNSSPERCLLGLIHENFVFGLSATSKIPRYLEHFNEKWLKEEIEYEANEAVKYIEPDDEDKAILKHLSEVKANTRKNYVEVSIAERSNSQNHVQFIKQLKEDTGVISVAKTHGYHSDRLFYFFDTLKWIVKNPLNKRNLGFVDSHLVFVNSFKQIEYTLNRLIKNSEEAIALKLKVNRAGDYHFKVLFEEKELIILLLEKKAIQYFFEDDSGKEVYNSLFDNSSIVISITQYPSANNGVNLQYKISQEEGKEILQDYQTLHLLEAPYFYFSQGISSAKNDMKKDIWRLAQLHLADKIGLKEFNFQRNELMSGRSNLNNEYDKLNDFVLNQIAKIIQALGRIERVNDKLIGLQRGRISKSVLRVFNRYFYNEEMQCTIKNAKPYFSDLANKFFAAVEGHSYPEQDVNNNKRPETATKEDIRFQKKMSLLVSKIKAIQTGQFIGDEALLFIEKWIEIRKASLRMEFSNATINKLNGVYYENRIGEDQNIISNIHSPWYLQNLSTHSEVSSYFHSKGYTLEFSDQYNYRFFTPSFYQQIYLGALGEEAAKALFAFGTHNYKIKSPETYHLTLFEEVDFVIPKLNWFVDAKFYSKRNMSGMPLDESKVSLVEIIKSKAPKTLSKIRSYESEAKLIIVNANSLENAAISYYDIQFNICSERECDVIVFPGLGQLRGYLNKLVT